jgi:hypothetical protein
MYERVSTNVRSHNRIIIKFSIIIELHLESTLSSYNFTLVLDVFTEHIQELATRCIFFADDVVMVGKSREELNGKLETMRQALEVYNFRLSRNKI